MPRAAWVLAWTCLAGQVFELLTRGPSTSNAASIVVSMVLSALVVTWVSAGVLQARPVRFWFAAILFGLVALLGAISLILELPDPDRGALVDVVGLAFWVAQLLALLAFSRTPYFRVHRADQARPRPDITGPLLVAVVVGLLGGFTAPSTGEDTPNRFEVRLERLRSTT